MEEQFMGNQVVTEFDGMQAVFDYIALQLDGRFRIKFPNHHEVINALLDKLRSPFFRLTVEQMQMGLLSVVSEFTAAMTACALTGCTNKKNHAFLREVIDLIWDSRRLTGEWLRGQGIVPGQSVN